MLAKRRADLNRWCDEAAKCLGKVGLGRDDGSVKDCLAHYHKYSGKHGG